MRINKIFDIILNIDNINYIFTKNINDKLLELISNKYVNKCFMSSYILKINKIINRSLMESNQNDLNCSFNISIQFEAECLVYNKNEVILDMVIQEKINNNIITKKDNILALLKNNDYLSSFKKGDKIPLIVGKVKYSLGSDKISINSYPFIPITNESIYYKIDKLKDSDIELLQENIIKYIEEEEDIKKNILTNKNNTWEYFQKLVYPYKDYEKKVPKKTVDLFEYIENISKYNNFIISLNDKYDISKRLLIIDNENEVSNYIKNNSYLIIFELFKKYYLYLKLINDLSITYNTEKLIKDNIDIFNIYNNYKK